eukprot:scaffold1717_cov117-Cylindrotheca_fusiformis.AAC.6
MSRQKRSLKPPLKTESRDNKCGTGTNPFDSDWQDRELENMAIEDELEIEAEEQVEINLEDQVQTMAETDGNIEFLVVTNINEQAITSVSEQQVTSLMSSNTVKSYDTDNTTETHPVSGVSVPSDRSVGESTKELLKRAGRRLEYQQRADEMRQLKRKIEAMEKKAEEISEQLRRSIDSKNDLLIAQQELEIFHEKCLRGKDIELDHLKAFCRRLTDKQAENELAFMNEISSLSKQLSSSEESHRAELAEKDDRIDQLEKQVKSLRIALVRGKEVIYA